MTKATKSGKPTTSELQTVLRRPAENAQETRTTQ
jgi:hypothetical protein